VQRALRVALALAREPLESLERIRDKRAERRDRALPPPTYQPEAAFLQALHTELGAAWPCPEADRFEAIWVEVEQTLAQKELRFGRATYGGWDDGDKLLARTLWCLVRHLWPTIVVETGVARGITSRVMLEGLEQNGSGHLWSIDLPPLLERGLAAETGAAITEALRPRWTYVRGSSRRKLPALARKLGAIDLFVHDSFHSERNLLFEWETVLPFLQARGVLVADDVQRHHGLASFIERNERRRSLVGEHTDGKGMFAVIGPARPARPDSASSNALGAGVDVSIVSDADPDDLVVGMRQLFNQSLFITGDGAFAGHRTLDQRRPS
jgi:predicted O-methyltransferase YrrM